MSNSNPRICWYHGAFTALLLCAGAGCSEDTPLGANVSPPPAAKSCFDFRDYLHTAGFLETAGGDNAVAVGPGHVFVVGENGLKIVGVGQVEKPELVATVTTPDAAWDVDWADSVAYVACGGFGLVAVDVRAPASPTGASRSWPTIWSAS